MADSFKNMYKILNRKGRLLKKGENATGTGAILHETHRTNIATHYANENLKCYEKSYEKSCTRKNRASLKS